MNRLKLKGVDVTDCVDLEGLETIIRYNSENKTVEYVNTTDLRLVGEAYQIVKDEYLADCYGVIEAELDIGCCDVVFDNVIVDNIKAEICLNECEGTVPLISNNQDNQKYQCLNKKYWFDCDFINDVQGRFFSLDDDPTGLDFGYIGYSIKEIIQYQAERCGLDWCTPAIDGTPYECLYIIPNQFAMAGSVFNSFPADRCGRDEVGIGTLPTMRQQETLPQLLDRLGEVMCTDYVIKDCKLTWGTNSQLNIITGTLDTREGCTEDKICITADTSTACAYFDGRFQSDPEYGELQNYSNVIDWNEENNPHLVGACLAGSTFSPRFNINNSLVYNSPGNFDFSSLKVDRLLTLDKTSAVNNSFPEIIDGIPNGAITYEDRQPNLYDTYWANKRPGVECEYLINDFCYIPDNFCEAVQVVLKNGLNTGFITDQGTYKADSLTGEIVINWDEKKICVRKIVE